MAGNAPPQPIVNQTSLVFARQTHGACPRANPFGVDMAENDDADSEDLEGEGFDEDVVRQGGGTSRKKLLLVFLLPVLLLAGGGGAFLTGKLDPFLDGEADRKSVV